MSSGQTSCVCVYNCNRIKVSAAQPKAPNWQRPGNSIKSNCLAMLGIFTLLRVVIFSVSNFTCCADRKIAASRKSRQRWWEKTEKLIFLKKTKNSALGGNHWWCKADFWQAERNKTRFAIELSSRPALRDFGNEQTRTRYAREIFTHTHGYGSYTARRPTETVLFDVRNSTETHTTASMWTERRRTQRTSEPANLRYAGLLWMRERK